jgi:acylphosphatase
VSVGEEQAARRFYVNGIVQGVGYRYFSQRAAHRLGLMGYAKNLRDGRVEVYAMGPAESLDAFRTNLERGPGTAFVSAVLEEQATADPRFAGEFSIEYDE